MAAIRIHVRMLGTVQGVCRPAGFSALKPTGSDTDTSICCIKTTLWNAVEATRQDGGDHKCCGPGMRRYLQPARCRPPPPAAPPAARRSGAAVPGDGLDLSLRCSPEPTH